MVYIFVSLVHYWENFAFMFQLLWEKKIKFRLQLQGILSRTPAPLCRRGTYPQFSGSRGTRGTTQMCTSSVFRLSGSATEFSDDIAAICARIWEYILPLNLSIFLRPTGWMRWISGTPKNRIWFTRLCFWHLVGWDREVHSLREYTFHRYHWFVGKHFPVSCAAGNSAVFALSSSSLEIPEFSRPQIR